MMEDKWKTLLGNVKDTFPVEDSGSEHIEEEGGIDIEYIVFEGPLGKMRLEFVTKAVILDKKMNYSNRIGSETQVTYVYSEDEKSSKMTAYKWNEDDEEWGEIDAGMFE
jgi:hypothetical protein